MKYFTNEELNYIASELLRNPSRETLKSLNDKYNGEINTTETPTVNWTEAPAEPLNNIEPLSDVSIQGTNDTEENKVPSEVPEMPAQVTPMCNPDSINYESANPVVEQTNNSNIDLPKSDNGIPSLDIGSVSPVNYQNAIQSEINNGPALEMPQVAMPADNSERRVEPVQVNGNVWDTQTPTASNMMQTTDNFNATIDPVVNQNVNNEPVSFFQSTPSQPNNPIPVSGLQMNSGPTMFGQLEQNFNNGATN